MTGNLFLGYGETWKVFRLYVVDKQPSLQMLAQNKRKASYVRNVSIKYPRTSKTGKGREGS